MDIDDKDKEIIFLCDKVYQQQMQITNRVHIMEANGPSYRLRESKRRLKKNRPDADDPPRPTMSKMTGK